MRRLLRRSMLAVLLPSAWAGLLIGAVAAGQAATRAGHDDLGFWASTLLTMAAGGYAVIAVTALAWSGVRHAKDGGDLIEAIGIALSFFGILAWVWGFIIAMSLPTWYLERYGVETDAGVSAERCDGGDGPRCAQDLKVTSATGRDLGWVGCHATGHWKVGEPVRVRADPDGWAAPQINCDAAGFLDTMIPVSLAVGGTAFAAAAAAPLIAARGRTPEDAAPSQPSRTAGPVADEPVEDSVPEPHNAIPSDEPRYSAP